MHTLPPDAPRILPAAVLAFVLLGVLAAGGWRVMTQVRTAPSTPLPAQALSENHTATPPRSARRVEALRPVQQQEDGPGWGTLTTAQKEVLYPLAERWAVLSEVQKRHWINLAGTFKTLSPDEQHKMVARITDWASLSTQQRSQARLNYAVANRLAADSKKAQWEAYQALSAEEKKQLAAKATPKPSGAATALRPVSPRKLAKVPAAASTVSASPANLPKIPPVTDFHTTQAMPVMVPVPAVVVETAPVAVPVAVPASLPPLDAAPPAEPPAPSSDEPIHQPQ